MSYFAPKSEATGLYHTAQLASPCNGTRGKPAERNPPVGKWVASREPDTASAFIGGVWELKRLKVVGREPIIPANTLEWLRRQGRGSLSSLSSVRAFSSGDWPDWGTWSWRLETAAVVLVSGSLYVQVWDERAVFFQKPPLKTPAALLQMSRPCPLRMPNADQTAQAAPRITVTRQQHPSCLISPVRPKPRLARQNIGALPPS